MADITPESRDRSSSPDELLGATPDEDIIMTQMDERLPVTRDASMTQEGGGSNTPFNEFEKILQFSAAPAQKRPANQSLNGPATPRDRHKRRHLNTPEGPITVESCLDDIQDLLTQANFLALDAEPSKKKDIKELQNIFQEYIQKGTLRHMTTQIHLEVGRLTEINRQIATKILVPENREKLSYNNHASRHASGGNTESIHPNARPATGAANQRRAIFNPDLQSGSSTTAPGGDPPEPLWTTIIRGRARSGSRSRQRPTPSTKSPDNSVITRKQEERSRKLILFEAVWDTTKTPMTLRNHINLVFKKHKIDKPVIANVARSRGGNIILMTTRGITAQYLLDSEVILQEALPYTSAQLDQSWHKVIAHGVPLSDFNTN